MPEQSELNKMKAKMKKMHKISRVINAKMKAMKALQEMVSEEMAECMAEIENIIQEADDGDAWHNPSNTLPPEGRPVLLLVRHIKKDDKGKSVECFDIHKAFLDLANTWVLKNSAMTGHLKITEDRAKAWREMPAVNDERFKDIGSATPEDGERVLIRTASGHVFTATYRENMPDEGDGGYELKAEKGAEDAVMDILWKKPFADAACDSVVRFMPLSDLLPDNYEGPETVNEILMGFIRKQEIHV